MTARAELSSLSTALDDLTGRLRAILAALEGAERDALETELAEVERSLDNARRRLARVVSGAGR
ncbi:MAG: hypothetical protein ACYCUG_09190 [Acidimicrobiales bacterium]